MSLLGSGAGEQWRIAGEEVELTVTSAGEPVNGTGTERAQHGFDQLCRVDGRLGVDGGEHEVTSLGARGGRDAGS